MQPDCMFGIFKPITIKSDDFTIKLNLFEPRKGKQTTSIWFAR